MLFILSFAFQLDNRSIAYASNFTEWLDPHYSSGPYNRVFYIVVKELNVPIKEAFGVFLHANRFYWHQLTDYTSGACDVVKVKNGAF